MSQLSFLGQSQRRQAPAAEEENTWSPGIRAFVAMRATYRISGGMLRAENLAQLLEAHSRKGASSLDNLLASRAVYGFHWHESMWIPMFQFDPDKLSVNHPASRVREALGPDFDDWSLASWFTRKNPKLENRRPVDLLKTGYPELMQAAREDCAVGFDASAGRHAVPRGPTTERYRPLA
ncbi:MAG: hypothetical protein ABI040_11525 [Rhodoferax sp.]